MNNQFGKHQTTIFSLNPNNICLHFRREEKQYVEGMEDEDTRRETQNLAYPPGKIMLI